MKIALLTYLLFHSVILFADCDLSSGSQDLTYPKGKIQGVVTISHGLNQNPQMLQYLQQRYLLLNFVTNVVTLEGHRQKSNTDYKMRNIDEGCWERQMKEALIRSSRTASLAKVKHLFLGYSVSALVGVDVLLDESKLVDEMILLAPAIKVRFYSKLVNYIPLSRKTIIPSAAPEKERANIHGTSLAAYRELFRTQKHLVHESDLERINLPTKVIVHEQDELVSPKSLQNWIVKSKLTKWSISIIEGDKLLGDTFYHQLTVPWHLGETIWDAHIGKVLFDGV